MKEYTITMTSKGQFTMPIEIRKAFGVSKKSNKLKIIHDETTNKIALEKPKSFKEIREMTAAYIKPGTEPLLDPRAFYETRKPRL